jgi:hypothetical protein
VSADRYSVQALAKPKFSRRKLIGGIPMQIRSTATATLALAFTVSALAQEDVRAKGIFVDNGDSRQTAMKFNVLLDRAGRQTSVPSTHRFVNGDRMKFQFELNREAYVYVLHRTVNGEPDNLRKYAGPMGIDIIRDDDRRQPDQAKYQVLFPARSTGQANRLASRRVYSVPTGEVFFNMDDNPGIEKLFVVVSDSPLDISRWPGVVGEVGAAQNNNRRPNRDDSDDDATSRLKRYAANSEMSVSKGMGVVNGYGIGIDRAKPMVFQVDLNHYRR